MRQKLSKAAQKTIELLRKPPRARLQRTAGLAQALSEKANRGSRTYRP